MSSELNIITTAAFIGYLHEESPLTAFPPLPSVFQGYHRPNHYIATQGKNEKKLSKYCLKNCSAETRRRWDILFFFFLHRLFILERCAGVGQYLSEHPLTLFAHSLSNRSLMLSHVCARGLWYCSVRTHTHTHKCRHTLMDL